MGVSRITRGTVGRVTVAATSLCLASATASAAYLSVDFQGDTVGGDPGGYAYYAPPQPDPNNFVRVVDGSSSPADPFGGAGNKSLMTVDDGSVNDTRISWLGAPGGLVNGVFKTKFYLSSTTGFTLPYMNIRLGKEDQSESGVANIAAWLLLSHPVAPGQFVIDNTDGPYNVLDNALSFNTVNELEITFNAAAQTFSGKLNGIALSAGAKTTWNFYSPMSSIESVMFNTGSGSGVDDRVFIDDVSLDVIPEPSMLSVAGMSLVALVRRRRRS